MDQHVKDYYKESSDKQANGHFHRVISLHENPSITQDEITERIPNFHKGWFELAHFSSKDRIDFMHDFWVLKIPFHLKFTPFIDKFFLGLDDIGIYLTQKKYEDPFEAHMVYSLKGDQGFFKGLSPATEQEISNLQNAFPNVLFPSDFLAFLNIHNGFSKATDTGIIPIQNIENCYANIQKQFSANELCTSSSHEVVDTKKLIPFYESFGMPYYQCFWEDWYPENEMGNVYYSAVNKTISNVKCSDPASDTMAFSTFTEWLMFYLESMES